MHNKYKTCQFTSLKLFLRYKKLFLLFCNVVQWSQMKVHRRHTKCNEFTWQCHNHLSMTLATLIERKMKYVCNAIKRCKVYMRWMGRNPLEPSRIRDNQNYWSVLPFRQFTLYSHAQPWNTPLTHIKVNDSW